MTRDWVRLKPKQQPIKERFWEKVDIRGEDDCWNWMASKNKTGYGYFGIKGKNWKSNRAAWMLTNGDIPNGLSVCHHCDNPSCCNPVHLFLGTHTDNIRDGFNKNRYPKTHESRGVKLTSNQVIEIRRLCEEGMRKRDIAQMYGVCRGTIGKISRRELWIHI